MKLLSSFALFAAFMYCSTAFALVEPAALCGIESVAPSGFSDPGRNPALLPFNTASSVGAAGSMSPFQKFSLTAKPSGKTTSDYRMDGDEKTSAFADGTAGLLLRFTNSAIGFSAAGGDDGFYSKTSSDRTLSGTINMYDQGTGTNWSQTLTMKSHETGSRTAPSFCLAWGYRTSDSFSWGLSIQGGMAKKTVSSFTSDIGTSTASGDFQNSLREKTDTSRYSGRIRLGFLYRDENTEAGFLLTSSELISERISYSYAFDSSTADLSGTALNEGKTDTSSPFSMAGPPSLTIGVRYMTAYIDWVGEGHVCVGGSRNVKSIDFSYDMSAPQTQTSEENTAIEAYGKGGLIFHPSSAFKLCAGLGYSIEGTKNWIQSTNGNDETQMQIIMASAGTELSLGRVTIGAAALYGDALSRGRSWKDGTGMLLRFKGSLMRVSGGVALNF